MRALVIYESMYGNTQRVAEAVADGLRKHLPTTVAEVGTVADGLGDDVALLVVGGPTHAFSMSRDSTRADAASKVTTPVVSRGRGLREWIDAVCAHNGSRPPAATFATKVRRPRLFGSAASAAAKRLRRGGFPLVTPPANFWVEGSEGPLSQGALESAQAWGDHVGAQISPQWTGTPAR
jgi:hypothetical protein